MTRFPSIINVKLPPALHLHFDRIWYQVLARSSSGIHGKADNAPDKNIAGNASRSGICRLMRYVHINGFAALLGNMHHKV